jgi:hypothetical protein
VYAHAFVRARVFVHESVLMLGGCVCLCAPAAQLARRKP